MKRILVLISAIFTPVSALHAVEVKSSKPNVVYIMADDLGWGDISAHGGGVKTPNIDRLFKRGVEMTQFMGWCVCSPTRAMLLTGRHPFRVGTGPEVGGELATEETTIAEASRRTVTKRESLASGTTVMNRIRRRFEPLSRRHSKTRPTRSLYLGRVPTHTASTKHGSITEEVLTTLRDAR